MHLCQPRHSSSSLTLASVGPMERSRRRLAPPLAVGTTPTAMMSTWQQVLEFYLQDQDLNSLEICDVQDNEKFPVLITCQRWIDI